MAGQSNQVWRSPLWNVLRSSSRKGYNFSSAHLLLRALYQVCSRNVGVKSCIEHLSALVTRENSFWPAYVRDIPTHPNTKIDCSWICESSVLTLLLFPVFDSSEWYSTFSYLVCFHCIHADHNGLQTQALFDYLCNTSVARGRAFGMTGVMLGRLNFVLLADIWIHRSCTVDRRCIMTIVGRNGSMDSTLCWQSRQNTSARVLRCAFTVWNRVVRRLSQILGWEL